MKDLEQKIRELCTYHSEGGTSGYNLSEQQFQKLFTLFRSEVREILDEIEKLDDTMTQATDSAFPLVQKIHEIRNRYLGEETDTNQEDK